MASFDELFGTDDNPVADTTATAVAEPVAVETPEVPEETPETQSEAKRKRDEATGRFVKGEEDDDAPALAERGTLPADSTPKPTDTPTEVVAEAPVVEPEPTPWKVSRKVRGVDTDLPQIPGALHKPGAGVFIPEGYEGMGFIEAKLWQAQKVPELQRTVESQRQQLDQNYTRHQLENAAFVQVFERLIDPTQGPAWIEAAAANPMQAIRELTLAFKEARLNIQQEHGSRVLPESEPRRAGEPPQDVVDQVWENTADVFERALAREWPDISATERQELEARLNQKASAFWERALTDDPEGRWLKGQVAVNQQEMETYVRGVKAGRVPPPAAAKALPLTPKPPPILAKPVVVPPAVGGGARVLPTSEVGKPKAKAQSFSTRKEFNNWWDSPL